MVKRIRRKSSEKKAIIKTLNKSCVYCGCTNRFLLNIDHIIPLSKGGKDDESNMQATCRACNGIKSDMGDKEFKKYLKILNSLSDINKLRVSTVIPTIKLKPYVS